MNGERFDSPGVKLLRRKIRVPDTHAKSERTGVLWIASQSHKLLSDQFRSAVFTRIYGFQFPGGVVAAVPTDGTQVRLVVQRGS